VSPAAWWWHAANLLVNFLLYILLMLWPVSPTGYGGLAAAKLALTLLRMLLAVAF
jgi:hypothetical protein